MPESFIPPLELLDFIKKYNKFIIMGHEEPDADCIGSQLALSSMLLRLGKKPLLRSSGPFRKTEVLPYKDLFSAKINEDDRTNAAVIIVDCPAPSRTGALCGAIKGLPLAIIDHHAPASTENRLSAADCAYIAAAAASSTVLVFSLFKALNLDISKDEACFLFLGLCTDTGFFRHIDSGGEEIFQIAASLVKLGANPKETFSKIHGGKTLNSRLLLGRVISHTESYFNGKLLVTTEELRETQKYGVENRDSDALYQILMSVEGVEAVAVIRQSSSAECAIGLRSLNSVDVSKIAAVFGGGGHKNAAGAYLKGSIAMLKQPLLDEFEKIFS
jgi:phosphoesterase RecJ-like protein